MSAGEYIYDFAVVVFGVSVVSVVPFIHHGLKSSLSYRKGSSKKNKSSIDYRFYSSSSTATTASNKTCFNYIHCWCYISFRYQATCESYPGSESPVSDQRIVSD